MNLNNLNLPPERRKALEQVLDQAWKDYQDNLTNLTDAAADEIETVLERDPLNARETVREYTAAANRLADDYYATVRTAWAEYAGVTMPDFDPGSDLEPERVLWQVQGGFANTDYNGLTYSQVMAGQARSGATIDDLWPSFSNIDDAQQFITDMIRTGARLTERRNIRLDPTKPKWARVPKGPKTCAFCAILASRGYAYTSEEAAGGKGNIYHADCHCQPMPNWGKQVLAGYDETAYKAEYERMKALADREYDGDILKAYRSSPGVCTDSVVPEALKKTPGRPPKFDAKHPFRTFLGSGNLRDAVVGTNPMFDEGPEYRNNCQRCVVAYEMRRRGYAVTAMPRPMDPRTGLPALDTDTNRWGSSFKGDWRSCGSDSGLDGASALLDEWGKGSRAFVEVEWLDGTRHVFVAENLKDGIHFMDPQTGSMNVSRYFEMVNHGMTRIMRVDDAEPTELVLKYCKEGQR